MALTRHARWQTDPSIIIYQEQATSSTIAEKTAYIEQITIGGSLPATYVRGTGKPDPTARWSGSEVDAEVLVFDQNGVRTFIVYRYGQEQKDELVKIAESMLAG